MMLEIAHLLLELVELIQIVNAQSLLKIIDDSLQTLQLLVQMRDPRCLPDLESNSIDLDLSQLVSNHLVISTLAINLISPN